MAEVTQYNLHVSRERGINTIIFKVQSSFLNYLSHKTEGQYQNYQTPGQDMKPANTVMTDKRGPLKLLGTTYLNVQF